MSTQVNASSNAHYLNHLADPSFIGFWDRISIRSDKRVVLTMFGSGSFWRKEAFAAVANLYGGRPDVPGDLSAHRSTSSRL